MMIPAGNRNPLYDGFSVPTSPPLQSSQSSQAILPAAYGPTKLTVPLGEAPEAALATDPRPPGVKAPTGSSRAAATRPGSGVAHGRSG